MQQDQCVLTLLPVAFFFPAAFIHPSLQYPFLFVAPRISRLSSCLFPFRLPAPHRARFERLVHGRGKSAHNAAHCRVYHLCQNGQPKRDRMAALHGGGAEWSDYWQWIQPGYRAARRRGICMRRHLGQGGVPSLALIDCSSLPSRFIPSTLLFNICAFSFPWVVLLKYLIVQTLLDAMQQDVWNERRLSVFLYASNVFECKKHQHKQNSKQRHALG